MADKPFIAARLRNPTDAAPVAAKPKQDFIGGTCAILAAIVTILLLVVIFLDWEILKTVALDGSGI